MPVDRKSVTFVAPGRVELRTETLPPLKADEVLVETHVSAISAGTEMLVYRGQFPRDAVDSHDLLSSSLNYPLAYGYACIGRVEAIGDSVPHEWDQRLVFAFQPHTSHFVTTPKSLFPVPESISADTAVFLPNMETAVNLVQDAAPLLGERALVLGQGIVGLLTSSLLHEFPLGYLAAADRYELRRKASLELGVDASFDPSFDDFRTSALQPATGMQSGYDLVIELSGNPSALDDAIALTAFSGRIVIGSWYGEKRVLLDLGGKFHRSRIKLISSQVSSISPELSGRWDKSRRFEVAWNALKRIEAEKWITHRFSLEQAAQAYQLLDNSPELALQIIFNYK
jgi:2-desacetyl-2-hydroxyethyl bacteriochlorophyllide A dehydrogenase